MGEEALKPSEWEKMFTWIEKLSGFEIPYWVKLPLALLLFAALVISILLILVAGISKIQELWFEKIAPRIYNPEEKQRSRSRRLFAQHLAREIGNINAGENWRDDEFTELEAEVEAEGQRRSWLPFYSARGIRRERSLTFALSRSTERLVLVEGEPGSGKSVALRHVGLDLAAKASKSQRLGIVLPVYVNLKLLRRGDGVAVDRELIRSLVIKSMNRFNDRFVDEFITANFDAGVKDGTWFFLFDSFDEIPDILSSIEADATVAAYTQAIADFLGGLNACRAVVASRFYRGPEAQGWRKFRILDLSPQRQLHLIDKALIVRSSLITAMVGDLQNAAPDVRNMAGNPLLLGLLCEHVRLGHQFPTNAFEVYSKYIESRLNRDAARVTERYEIGTEEVAEIAEEIAFSITADRQIGLTPRRSELWAAMQRQRFRRSRSHILKALDALEYMKLGKQDASDGTSDPQFTFAHRRFQEYFATSIVVRDTARVMPGMLLLDARWRETAVVICQTGRDADSAPLLCEISTFLAAAAPPTGPETVIDQSGKRKFAWQPGTIHVLGILQDGYSARMESLPTPIRKLAGRIVSAGFHDGDFLDKKLALEVAGTAPEQDLVELLRISLTLDSPVINDVVYRQVARLLVPPPDLMTALRLAVLRLTFESWPVWNRVSINAFVRRVPQAPELAAAAHLALWIGPIGSILAALIVVPLSLRFTPLSAAVFMAILACTSTYRVKKYFVWSGRYIERMHFILSLVVLQLLILAPIKIDIDLERTETNPQLAVSRLFQDMFLKFVNFPSATLYMTSCSVVLTIYALAWHSASIYAVRSGTYLRPPYWPFTPFSLARPLIAYLKDLKVLDVITPILAVIFITGITFLAVETSSFIDWKNLLVPILWISGSILGLPIVVASCRGCVPFLRDTWRTKRWFKQMKGGVSGNELRRIYHLARTECGRADLLERVQGRGVVETEADSAGRVQQLASYIDARIAGEPMRPHCTTAQSPFSRFRLRLDTLMDSFDWSQHKRHLNRQRDSIYLILEPNRRAALTEYGASADTGRPTEPG